MLFVGDDWAEDHHDLNFLNPDGTVILSKRVPEGVAGIAVFHGLVADAGVGDPAEVVVGIETDRGLWVNALVASGYQVHAINPASAHAYRTRHNISGAKSDPGDARLLANIVRTDAHLHRRVSPDSDLVESVRILARAHQNLIWERTRNINRLRRNLLEYFPVAVAAFTKIGSGDALAVLAAAPTPKTAAKLTKPQIRGALKRGGRQRNLDIRTVEYQQALRAAQLHLPDETAAAFGAVTVSLVAVIGSLNQQIAGLEETMAESFNKHPDADIYLSLPGVSIVTGARMLGEFGDNPERYANAKARRNYAGTSPLTETSGKRFRVVKARHIRNRRLADATQIWANNARLNSPGAQAFYNNQIAGGRGHHKALRALANKLVGQLHGALKTSSPYLEDKAWARQNPPNQIDQAA